MGEWKRIFCSPRRLLTLGLPAVLSVVFFFFGRMPYFGKDSFDVLIKNERYYADTVERVRTMSADDAYSMLDDERRRLDDYYRWRQNGGYVDYISVPQEQFECELAENEYLSSLSDLGREAAASAISASESRLDEIREQLDYISGYSDYLDRIQKQAAMQSMTSVFGSANTFSHRNIEKTAAEFDTLRGVEVRFGADRAYEGWIEFELADYLYLFVIVIFVFAFLEEKRAGLSGVVRSCRYGRAQLCAVRVCILASASVLGVVLIYGANLILSVLLSGNFTDMGRSVQSLECFRTLTEHVTVGGWIAEYLLVKAASGFTVGLLLWCVLGVITNAQYSTAVLGVVVAVEYALFAFLPVQSIFNPVKYFNLFSYIRTSELYTEYLNINLFGYPFGIRQLALCSLPVFAAVFLALVLLTSWKRRPEGSRNVLSRIAVMLDTAADKMRRRLSVGGWETYKTLVYQRCIFIIAIVVIAGGSLGFTRSVEVKNDDVWYSAYLRDITGPITSKTDEYIKTARENAARNDELMRALDRVETHINELRENAAADGNGYEPWIADDKPLRAVYGPDAVDAQCINAAVAMVFVIFLCAAMMPFEQKSGVVFMLRSQKRGRAGVLGQKLLLAAAMTAVAFGSVYMREYTVFTVSFSGVDINAPIRAFECMADSPFNVRLWQYLLILYILRYVMMFALACTVLCVSSYIKTVETSYIALTVLFGIPALLYSLGVSAMRYVSPVRAVSAAEQMWAYFRDGGVHHLIPLAVWAAAGALTLTHLIFKWCMNKRQRAGV